MDGGELASVFRSLAKDAVQTTAHIGKSVADWFSNTADIAEDNADHVLAADEENVQAISKLGGLDGKSGSANLQDSADSAGSAKPNKFADILNGAGDSRAGTSRELTSGDKFELNNYTGTAHKHINSFLRNPKDWEEGDKYLEYGLYTRPNPADMRAQADRVSTALGKLPPRPGQTYRGVDLSDDLVKQYRPGQVVTERGFTSTSADASKSFDRNSLMVITGHTGRNISEYSRNPSEQEILYDKGTDFQVISNEYDPVSGKNIIHLEEVRR